MENLKNRKCGDCGESISFDIFLRDNPAVSVKQGRELWEDPFIVTYCPGCFLKRPEKPYRYRRRFRYNNRLNLRV
ncbi:MAG: hypothetical protein ACFFFB_24745 [Candidatus Heimdallarchaeota archaeon]